MPLGRKRTQKEYEKEIEDAVKRFKKYPEYTRQVSNDVDSWKEFLDDIGIYPDSQHNGSDFFERIRQKDYTENHPITSRMATIDIISDVIKEWDKGIRYIETTRKGTYYKEVYSGNRIVYRDISTGKFTKRYD